MRVRITGIPREKQSPDVRVNPFSSPYADVMKYGGQKPGESANGNRVISTAWDWMQLPDREHGYNPSPYSTSSRTLPEAKYGTGNINAEKQEQVMGDFNGDGMPVLMNVNGPTHTEGGKDVNVPNGSFVFSDTKNLQIKDPDILKSFGMSKAATPAVIAKKYDLQKYKAVIDDPDADEIDKKTAQLMYTNFVNKLNTLASVQESMKESRGLSKPQVKQQPVAQSGGSFRFDQNPLPDTYNPAPIIPYMGNEGYGPDISVTAKRPGDQHLPIIGGGYDVPTPPQYAQMQPYTPGNGTDTPQDPDAPGGHGKNMWQKFRDFRLNPDQMRNGMLALRALSLPQYHPIRETAHGAIPDAVYMDPTRALAVISENANATGHNLANSGQGAIGRANVLTASSQSAPAAANVVGQYANENAQIANRANTQAADIYNKLYQEQQGYNKTYNEDQFNAARDTYGAQAAIQNEYLKGQYADRARKTAAHNYNYINPFYSFDEQGFLHPKSKAESDAVAGIAGTKPGGGTNSMSPEQLEKYIADYKVGPEEANKMRRQVAMLAFRGPTETYRMNPMTGLPQSASYRGTTGQVPSIYGNQGYIPQPEEEKYGGPIKKQKVRIVSVPK